MQSKDNYLDTRFIKQHLRTSIFKSYILYIEKFYPTVDMSEICTNAGLPFDYVVEEDNWVSLEFEKRFMSELRKQVTDPDLVRKVGVFGATPEVVGSSIYFFVTKLLTTKTIFQKLPFMTSLINKVMSLDIVSMDKGSVIYKLSPIYENLSNYEQSIIKERLHEFAENTVGYFYQIPLARGLPAPKIEVKNDGDSVIMVIKFAQELETLQSWLDLIVVVLLPASTYGSLEFFAFDFKERVIWTLVALIGAMAFVLFRKMRHSAQTTINAANSLKKMDQQVETLINAKKQLARKLAESDAVAQIIKTLASADEEREILDSTCRSLSEVLRFDRSVILLLNESTGKLEFESGYGLGEGFLHSFKDFSLSVTIDSSDPKKISNVYRLGISILIDNVEEHINTLLDDASRDLLLKSKSMSFAAVPIRTASQSHGVLIADCYEQGKSVTQEDVTVLENIGRQLAVALEKSKNKRQLKNALKETKKLSESYSRFVPFETLKQMGYESVYNVNIGDGTNKIFAVLFNDIRDFSTLTEDMNPHDVLAFLNSYFGKMSPIIKKYNGIIDKFIGDCLMAIFPNPTDAIRASIEIQRELVSYNIERRIGGRKPVFSGVGVCYGSVVLGPVGFAGRLDITVLSDAVNTASRLDSLCKDLDAKILVSGVGSEIITSTDPEVMTIEHGRYKVKGKNKDVQVVEILDPVLIRKFEGLEMTKEMIEFKDVYMSQVIRKIELMTKNKAS